jgi:hypothetical protein
MLEEEGYNEAPGLPLALKLEQLALETMLLVRRKAVGGRRVIRFLNELRWKYLMNRRNVGKERARTRAARWTSAGARVGRNDAILEDKTQGSVGREHSGCLLSSKETRKPTFSILFDLVDKADRLGKRLIKRKCRI